MKKSILALAAVLGLAGAASAQDIMIEDFEAGTAGTGYLFQHAAFSGSTSGNFEAGSTYTTIDTDGSASTKSGEWNFEFTDAAAATAKGRVTTFNATTSGGLVNPIIDYARAVSMDLKITQGTVKIAGILSRDSGGTPGTSGAATDPIETISFATPIVLDASVNSDWQTVVFDISAMTVTGFTGNGILDNTAGTLEALYIEKGDANPVTLRVDNVKITDAVTSINEWTLY